MKTLSIVVVSACLLAGCTHSPGWEQKYPDTFVQAQQASGANASELGAYLGQVRAELSAALPKVSGDCSVRLSVAKDGRIWNITKTDGEETDCKPVIEALQKLTFPAMNDKQFAVFHYILVTARKDARR